MPSRINIGPEDGPYVAINEENGNLQLEDNSGNVVAEWDETNAQWDFANNTLNNVDALNSNSVNTEQASIGEDVDDGDDLSIHHPATSAEWSYLPGGGFASDEYQARQQAGAILTKDSDQTVADNDLVTVTWENDDEYNQGDASDLDNDGITVPSSEYTLGFFWAAVGWAQDVEMDTLRIVRDNSSFVGMPQHTRANVDNRRVSIASGPVPVTDGETYTVDVRHQDGADRNIEESNITWFKALLM